MAPQGRRSRCAGHGDLPRATFDALGLSEGEADRQVVVRVARFVGRGLHEDLEVSNYGLTDAQLRLEWEVSADFAGLVEQRSGKRQQNAPVDSAWRSTDGGG